MGWQSWRWKWLFIAVGLIWLVAEFKVDREAWVSDSELQDGQDLLDREQTFMPQESNATSYRSHYQRLVLEFNRSISNSETSVWKRRKTMVVFLHVHKAGGTTLCYVAMVNGESSFSGLNCNSDSMRDRVTLASGTPSEQKNVLNNIRAKKKKTFVANEWILPQTLYKGPDVTYVALFRNPLARLESHYAMAIHQDRHSKEVSSKLHQQWFKAAPENSEIAQRIHWIKHTPDNWQVRAVCGKPCAGIPFGKLEKEHLELAKEKLRERFLLIGIVEHFSSTVLLFDKVLRWRFQTPIGVHAHKGSMHKSRRWTVLQMEELSRSGSAELLEMMYWFFAVNLLDIELYNYAKTLFYEQAKVHEIQTNQTSALQVTFSQGPGLSNATREDVQAFLLNRTTACFTQCCTSFCAPLGKFWEPTARQLGLLP